jgi:hypothetical protein
LADAPTIHYLNSEFDLGLRPRPRQLTQPNLVRQVRELTVQAVLGAEPADAVLVRVKVPDAFQEHLHRCGLHLPRLLPHPTLKRESVLRPFGWSAEAIELNQQLHRPARHPDPDLLRRVNARSFARALERELDPHPPQSVLLQSTEELKGFLSRARAGSAWLIKSEHGNAGLANRRLRRRGLGAVDRRFVEERLKEDDRLLVEPWLPRERDFCAVFDVPFDARSFRVHETVCSADGALIGALFEPRPHLASSWIERLHETATAVAARLEVLGYFGPACIDAFSWRDGDRTRLRSLVDLNCRLSMSDAAYRLVQRLFPQRTALYRFFNRRKLTLPEDQEGALTALGDWSYDRADQQGILLASPLRVAGESKSWRPGKLALLFVGEGRAAVQQLERRFRERFEA